MTVKRLQCGRTYLEPIVLFFIHVSSGKSEAAPNKFGGDISVYVN